jgi:hypothetical protein
VSNIGPAVEGNALCSAWTHACVGGYVCWKDVRSCAWGEGNESKVMALRGFGKYELAWRADLEESANRNKFEGNLNSLHTCCY